MPKRSRLRTTLVPAEFSLCNSYVKVIPCYLVPEIPLPLLRWYRVAVIVAPEQYHVIKSKERSRIKGFLLTFKLSKRFDSALRAFARVVSNPIRRVRPASIDRRKRRQYLAAVSEIALNRTVVGLPGWGHLVSYLNRPSFLRPRYGLASALTWDSSGP